MASFNVLFVTVALFAIVLAGPGDRGAGGAGGEHKGPQKGPHGEHNGKAHGGHHGSPHGAPAFLANVSAEGKKAFEEVFKNENLTLAQIYTQVAALAEKYGVSALFKEAQANRTAHEAEVKKNTTSVISNLSAVSAQLAAIYQNKDQTRKAQHEAVEAIRKEHRVEVDAVHFIREHLGGHGGRRGGHHGGPGGFGRRHGGEHGDKKGPHGGDKKGPRGDAKVAAKN